MRDSGNIGRAASAGGSRDAAARNSNRATVAYNNIQMIATPLSVAGGNSALNSETQPPRRPTPRILAIDYGRKRIGLALSDELGITAKPGKWRMKRRGLRGGCAKNWGSKWNWRTND